MNMSTEVLETLLSSDNVVYLMSADILYGTRQLPSMKELQRSVVVEKRFYVIDFSDTNGTLHDDTVKKCVTSKLAVFFPCELLVASSYKEGVMFTPIADKNNPELAALIPPKEMKEALEIYAASGTEYEQDPRNKAAADKGDDQTVPNISFYLNIQYDIPEECYTFKKSLNNFVHGDTKFCTNPHISLIFQVNLQRSLKFGVSGGATPDGKIVRISADKNTGGAGIHLNDKLTTDEYYAPWKVLDGWYREWRTSAIASDYSVDINASNGKASVLKTSPENNVDVKTEFRDISGFTLGVSGGGDVGKDGPKVKLDAHASYTQVRWVTFSTHDYKMERFTGGAQNIRFKMRRETYPKASHLLSRHTDPMWVDSCPADLKRVQPMGYASFVPKMDVIYIASPDETGTTTFSVDASVQIMPLYHSAYAHFYVIGAHLSYHGPQYDRDGKRAACKKTFDVDWEHAVFTGGRPVNLQSKAFANKCIDVDSNGKIFIKKGDLASPAQSFIFDNLGRYVSAKDVNKCLDGDNLNVLQPCSASLTQRWEWEEGTDHLVNVYSKKRLGCHTETEKLGLYTDDSSKVNTDMITAFTELFISKK